MAVLISGLDQSSQNKISHIRRIHFTSIRCVQRSPSVLKRKFLLKDRGALEEVVVSFSITKGLT